MALQTSGAISLADVQTEFGGVNPISISEYYGKVAGIPASGTISLSHFYGKSNIIPLNVGWSGDSFATDNHDLAGIDTSGYQYRFYRHFYYDDTNYRDEAGAWGTASQYGNFSNGSTLKDPTIGYYIEGIDVSGNLMRTVRYGGYSSTWVTYTLSNKAFSGSSTGGNPSVGAAYFYLDTSGGLIRFGMTVLGKYYGPYISLK